MEMTMQKTKLNTLIVMLCICRNYGSYVDPDTPKERHSLASNEYKLVFSDEFENDKRSFVDGEDPIWTALSLEPNTNRQVNSYEEENVFVRDGKLILRSKRGKNGNRPVSSAMIQSWNKFCFRKGYVEIKAKLPGRQDGYGLWPAFW
jgi:beta-glucanase (GH16 family)